MRALLLISAMVPAFAVAQPQYEIVVLSEFYGGDFNAVSIDEHGAILGNIHGMACIASNGTLKVLPTYNGRTWYAKAFASNGDVIGYDVEVSSSRSLLYRGGRVINLHLQGGGNGFPAAQGINEKGQITGTMFGAAFIWENGHVKMLPAPSRAVAHSINDRGLVVGRTWGNPSGNLAAAWIQGAYFNINPSWADSSQAFGSNVLGEIVGEAHRFGAPTSGAIVWRDGTALEVAPNEIGAAWDINDHSQVVGWSTPFGGGHTAFLWDDGDFYRLEDLIVGPQIFNSISYAKSINNRGQILASGGIKSILLNPVRKSTGSRAVGGGGRR